MRIFERNSIQWTPNSHNQTEIISPTTGNYHRPFVSLALCTSRTFPRWTLYMSQESKNVRQEQNGARWGDDCMLGIWVSLMNWWAATRRATSGISTLLKAFCYSVVVSMRFNVIDVRPTILFSGRLFFSLFLWFYRFSALNRSHLFHSLSHCALFISIDLFRFFLFSSSFVAETIHRFL